MEPSIIWERRLVGSTNASGWENGVLFVFVSFMDWFWHYMRLNVEHLCFLGRLTMHNSILWMTLYEVAWGLEIAARSSSMFRLARRKPLLDILVAGLFTLSNPPT